MTIRLPEAIHVINLDAASDRLDAVLRSFDTHLAGHGIALNRFVAIDAADVERRHVPGRLTWREKACTLSHVHCLQAAVATPGAPLWIAEDDVVFGAKTVARLQEVLASLQGHDWDVLLTDIFVTEPHGMVDVFKLWSSTPSTKPARALDLRSMAFAGATSYLVNTTSAAKLLDLYRTAPALDIAPDILFKRLAAAGKLTCLCVFPFATSVADAASQIQPDTSRQLLAWWNAFRWMLWEESDLAALDARLDAMERGFTEVNAARAGRILAGMLSPHWAPYLSGEDPPSGRDMHEERTGPHPADAGPVTDMGAAGVSAAAAISRS